jgi:hypothetical protein
MLELLADTNNLNVGILSRGKIAVDSSQEADCKKNSREKLIVLWHVWRRREMHIEFGWRT